MPQEPHLELASPDILRKGVHRPYLGTTPDKYGALCPAMLIPVCGLSPPPISVLTALIQVLKS